MSIRIVPLKVTGIVNVREVVFYSDRIKFLAAETRVFYYRSFARYEESLFKRIKTRLLNLEPSQQYVGERARTEFLGVGPRFFRFYTKPEICIWLPVEDSSIQYGDSDFVRIQDLLRENNYVTWDLT